MKSSDKRRVTAEYWEARLERMGLDMNTGRKDWLSYVTRLVALDRYFVAPVYLCPVPAEGILDWPISL